MDIAEQLRNFAVMDVKKTAKGVDVEMLSKISNLLPKATID